MASPVTIRRSAPIFHWGARKNWPHSGETSIVNEHRETGWVKRELLQLITDVEKEKDF